MRIRGLGVMTLVAWLAVAAQADEIGPKELRGEAAETRASAHRVVHAIREDARVWVLAESGKRETSLVGFAEFVRRLVPGAGGLPALATLPDRKALAAPERERLSDYARRLAGEAEKLVEAGLGGAGGALAYLAWRLDDGCEPAGAILGYTSGGGRFLHPRGLALRSATPQVSAPTADDLEWKDRHVLTYPFVEIHTTLPREDVADWAPRVDALVEWMRARFVRVPGYEEPAWPLELRIYRTPEEAVANGDRAPTPFAYWLEHGVVNAAAFRPGTMPMENVVQHELAHGFLREAFPPAKDGAVYSGWMTEAFAQWIYAASAAHPNDTRFWWVAERWLGPVLDELNAGRDVLGQLRKMNYAQGRTSPLAALGAVLCDYCAADPLRWEGFARFTAHYQSYREKYPDFERLLGDSQAISAELRQWAIDRTARFNWSDASEAPGSVPQEPAEDITRYGPSFRGRPASEWELRLRRESTRQQYIRELRAAGSEAVPVLLALLRQAQGHTPAIAAMLLGRLRPMSEEVLKALLEALPAGDHSVKAHVFGGFGHQPPPEARIVEAMIGFLDAEYYDYRIRAANVLAALGDTAKPVGVVALERRMASETDPSARITMAWALWKLGQPVGEMLPVVLAELEPGRTKREYAVRIVGRFEAAAEPAIPQLLALAKDDSRGVRLNVALTLGKIGIRSAEVLAALESLSEDDQPRVQQCARAALAQLR